MKNLCSGTQCGGFQFLLILDLWGISFHAMVVFGLGKNLLFKSLLGHCAPNFNEISILLLILQKFDIFGMVFHFENSSELLGELILGWLRKTFTYEFEAEDWELSKILWSIYSNSERSEQFLKQNTFVTCYWRFL